MHRPCPAAPSSDGAAGPPRLPGLAPSRPPDGAAGADPVPLRGRGAPGARSSPARPSMRPSAPLPGAARTGSTSTPTATSASGPSGRCSAAPAARSGCRCSISGSSTPRPVTVNVIRDGVPTPVPYPAAAVRLRPQQDRAAAAGQPRLCGLSPALSAERPARCSTSSSRSSGASYFRFLGRDQRYGLSARGLAINVGKAAKTEEFPFFREFWVEHARSPTPTGPSSMRCSTARRSPAPTVSTSTPAARRRSTSRVTLFPRRPITVGRPRAADLDVLRGRERPPADDDFRPELHDSDGLLMHTGAGEWIWRPLRNPPGRSDLGLHRQQSARLRPDAARPHLRALPGPRASITSAPGYWVEPIGGWGEGRVELVEIPTGDETHDNSSPTGRRSSPTNPARRSPVGYRMRAVAADSTTCIPGGKAVNTFQTPARASGSAEPGDPTHAPLHHRFRGRRPRLLPRRPRAGAGRPVASAGRITHTFVVPNAHTQRLPRRHRREARGRAVDRSAGLPAAGNRTLTETWTYPWTAE